MGQPPDGLMSNGHPFDEYVDGGVAEVGRGAMRFLTVVALDGPNHGEAIYRLGDGYNWHITVDLALDPGFPEGSIVSENLHITTGILWVPNALQTEKGMSGGTDRADSLPSGVPVLGRLGDYDMDGYLDGALIGVSNVPPPHMFLRGAPVVQVRHFLSDIPIAPLDAALLTVTSVQKYWEV